MKSRIKNSIRALILLTVFSLNTVVGFACSLGIDMGFNSTHHDKETQPLVHLHNDGKPHTHHKKNSHTHGKHSGEPHSADRHHHHSSEKSDLTKTGDNNCCSDDVVQFEKLDKSIPGSGIISHPLFLTSFVYVFYDTILPTSDIVKNIRQFVRSYHPPISNIRIAIQSFQI